MSLMKKEEVVGEAVCCKRKNLPPPMENRKGSTHSIHNTGISARPAELKPDRGEGWPCHDSFQAQERSPFQEQLEGTKRCPIISASSEDTGWG